MTWHTSQLGVGGPLFILGLCASWPARESLPTTQGRSLSATSSPRPSSSIKTQLKVPSAWAVTGIRERRFYLPFAASKSYPGLTLISRPSHQEIADVRVRPGFVFVSLMLRLEKVMTRLLSLCLIVAFLFLLEPLRAAADGTSDKSIASGSVPSDASGRSLNLDFETGTLADWKAEGAAFEGQPIEGDTVGRRRGDMHSGHAGRFWVGTYEKSGDDATGTLDIHAHSECRSRLPASWLVGVRAGTCVEIVVKTPARSSSAPSGDDREDLERVVVDLSRHLGQQTS